MKINTLIKVTGNLFISFFSQEKMNLSLIAKIKMNNTRKETIPNHCYFYGAQMFRGLWYYEEEGIYPFLFAFKYTTTLESSPVLD